MITDFSDSIILGLIQGLTEFFPVSSSGHLVFAKALLGVGDIPLFYDIFFHFATVLAILTYFKRDIFALVHGLVKYIAIVIGGGKNDADESVAKNARLAFYLIIGSIPAALAGLTFEDYIKSFFTSPGLVAVFLTITGIILLSTIWLKSNEKPVSRISALSIGLMQAFALFPGISRSGITIVTGLWLGIKPLDAVKFSFFLAVPIILGANILEFSSVPLYTINEEILTLLAGGIASYLSGLFAISIVLKLVGKARFHLFGVYCVLAGIIAYISV